MRVLCVAEKPSIAKSITQILSGGQFNTVSFVRFVLRLQSLHPLQRTTGCPYVKNYDFSYPQTQSFFTVTSVIGHLLEYEFDSMHSKWTSCDPFALFDAPVESSVKKESKPIAQNLANEAKRAQMLMIWTDCDREGESIGSEVANVCRKAQRNITVRRARFSAIIAQYVPHHFSSPRQGADSVFYRQIHHAAQHPIQLDMAQANAVEARILLDLKIGSAFTRLQTLTLQQRFDDLKDVISYGRQLVSHQDQMADSLSR